MLYYNEAKLSQLKFKYRHYLTLQIKITQQILNT